MLDKYERATAQNVGVDWLVDCKRIVIGKKIDNIGWTIEVAQLNDPRNLARCSL